METKIKHTDEKKQEKKNEKLSKSFTKKNYMKKKITRTTK